MSPAVASNASTLETSAESTGISVGDGATRTAAWLAPVYPVLLAGIFKLFGTFTVASFYVAALFNCVFSALVCLPLFRAALRIGNRPTAATAGWLAPFNP